MDNRQKHQKVCVSIQKYSSLVGSLGYYEIHFGVMMIISVVFHWLGDEAENIFLTHSWEYGLKCVWGLRSCEKFKVHFAFAIRHCLTR